VGGVSLHANVAFLHGTADGSNAWPALISALEEAPSSTTQAFPAVTLLRGRVVPLLVRFPGWYRS
jgi:hypothetical protein